MTEQRKATFEAFERHFVTLCREAELEPTCTRDELVAIGQPFFAAEAVEGYSAAKYAGVDARWLSASLERRVRSALAPQVSVHHPVSSEGHIDVQAVLADLKDFQRRTAIWAFERMF